MKRLDLSLGDPAADLALDEALLLQAEAGQLGETLRLWQFDRPVVVIGRGSKIENEAVADRCRAAAVPVLRRCSGGAAILAGPGCLMYSVVLSLTLRPALRQVDLAHSFVMQRLLTAVRGQLPAVQWQGTCDLTFGDRKFSGNSLRIARHHLLYHGTILYAADLDRIDRCLGTPPRQPDYRGNRRHADFITNVPIDPDRLRAQIATAFAATEPLTAWPIDEVRRLRCERYDDPAWHQRH